MKTLHTFIFRSYIGPFVMTLFISIFILFMIFLWKWVDELVGKGLSTGTLTELFFFASLSTVPLALPMAVLLSSLMTFGNLGEHYELAALKSSGLSLHRIMSPLTVFVFVLTIGAFLFSNYLLPFTNLKMISTLYDIRNQKPALNIKEGVFYNGIEGYSIRIGKIDADGTTIHNVMVYDHTTQSGNTAMTIAKDGEMMTTADKNYLIISLKDGYSYSEVLNQQNGNMTKPFMRSKFKVQTVNLDLSGFSMQKTEEELFKENHQMLNGKQLLDAIDTMQAEIDQSRARFFTALRPAYFTNTEKYWKRQDSLKAKPAATDFMKTLDAGERKRVYDIAVNTVSNVRMAIDSKVNEMESEERSIRRFEIEFWRKYTLSAACFIMLFIGAPLGAIIRKGGLGMPMLISIVLFILFWVITITGEKMAKEGTISSALGMWMGCAIYLPLGLWLTIKATADSTLFDYAALKERLQFVVRIFRKKKKHEGSSAV